MRLQVYDVSGRRVRTLIDALRSAGADQRVVWDGLDDAGMHVSSGVYLYRLEADDTVATRKMVLMQ